MQGIGLKLKLLIVLLGVCFQLSSVYAIELERRREQYDYDFGWITMPIAISIPGVGTGYGGFFQFTNINDTASDFLLTKLTGDFDITFAQLKEFYLVPKLLAFDIGRFEGRFFIAQYDRGIDSDPNTSTQAESDFEANTATMRLEFWDKRLLFLLNGFSGSTELLSVIDQDGNRLKSESTERFNFSSLDTSAILDWTDDFTDPRQGLRTGFKYKLPSSSEDETISEFAVSELNLTYYFPMSDNDTLLFNIFRSSATITKQATTDATELKTTIDLDCTSQTTVDKADCLKTEQRQIEQRIAFNRFGSATPLGGSNRMRAYPNQRFTAGHTGYMGLEYRMNSQDKRLPINWYVIGGIRTVLQTAFFLEAGSVSDKASDLTGDFKTSAGIGFRAIISGLIYRLDLAFGDEGPAMNVIIDYPMNLLSF